MKKITKNSSEVCGKGITVIRNNKSISEGRSSHSLQETIPVEMWIRLGMMGINLQLTA